MEKINLKEFNPSPRILLGPGPGNVHYRVYQAMATPVIGYLDPLLLSAMDEISIMLRDLFQTKNRMTLALPGTGSSGMEASFLNFVEPGDTVVIFVKGYFGERMAEMAARFGAKVVRIDQEWGKPFEPERVIKTLKEHPEAKICAIVHAETSTGVRQPLEEIGAYCRKTDTLYLVDVVTSLGGCEVKVDQWGIDISYSCSQKGIGVPPGLAPFTASSKAMDVRRARKTKVQGWYLDLLLLEKYWGEERVYHHTAPASMLYALREGLRIIFEEGLEARFKRHETISDALKMGLESLGFGLFAQEGYRLPMLTSAYLPSGVEDVSTRKKLLNEYNIEVGGGLGLVKGKIWRVGLMGDSCQMQYVHCLISALKEMLK
ncbi:MAG TPA: alanine--glyoxylate aminotransferase family protein [Thermodesulfobacteriota bacterium]|nr:alanine--glyoxylate aminotransferase family protein [Thermodesulfobacteriota bacterium]